MTLGDYRKADRWLVVVHQFEQISTLVESRVVVAMNGTRKSIGSFAERFPLRVGSVPVAIPVQRYLELGAPQIKG